MLNSVASLALIHRASRERSYTAGPYTSTPYTVRYGQQGARSTSKRFRASFI